MWQLELDPARGWVFTQKNKVNHHQNNILESQNQQHILGEITKSPAKSPGGGGVEEVQPKVLTFRTFLNFDGTPYLMNMFHHSLYRQHNSKKMYLNKTQSVAQNSFFKNVFTKNMLNLA